MPSEVIEKSFVLDVYCVLLIVLVAVTIMLLSVIAFVGVPEITPVVELSRSPLGNAPWVTDHVGVG